MLYLANHTTGMAYSPAYYLIGSCILGFIGLRLLLSDKTAPMEVSKEFFVPEAL